MSLNKNLIFFLHIEKAAGTTINYMFRNNYLNFLCLPTLGFDTNAIENAFTPKDAQILIKFLPKVRGFSGHTIRPFLNYGELSTKLLMVTFLREPISRYISHFHYQKFKKGINWEMEQFLEESRFDNFMTKKIAGEENLNIAKKILRNDFDFIGLLEEFDLSLILMKKHLRMTSFNIHYEPQRKNESNLSQSNFKSNERLQSKIIEKNQLDIALYKFANEEIFSKYKLQYESSDTLLSEVRRFQNLNRDYKFSQIKKWMWRIYRQLFYNLLYRFIHEYNKARKWDL